MSALEHGKRELGKLATAARDIIIPQKMLAQHDMMSYHFRTAIRGMLSFPTGARGELSSDSFETCLLKLAVSTLVCEMPPASNHRFP